MQRVPMFTALGEEVWYLDPPRTRVRLRDLREHLGRAGRYAGAYPWTVLAHSALCVGLARVEGYGEALVSLVALHDLHEAYVGDMPSGLKSVVPGWAAVEAAWERHVHAAFGVEVPTAIEARRVKDVDTLALLCELEHLAEGSANCREAWRLYGRAGNRHLDVIEGISQLTDAGLWRLVSDALQLTPRWRELNKPDRAKAH